MTDTTFTIPLKLNIQAPGYLTKHINNISKINMLLKESVLSFCTIDGNDQLTLLRSYQLPKNHLNNFDEIFEQLLETDTVLAKHNNGNNLTFAYFDPNYSLVPKMFFDEKEMSVYYQKDSNKKLTESEQLLYNRVEQLEHFNVFCIPKSIYTVIDKQFNATFKSTTTAFLNNLIHISRKSESNLILANVGNHLMDVAVIKDKSVSFNNSFEYNTPEDFLYYLSNTAQREGINPKTDTIILTGNVYKSGGLYMILRKYFEHIEFGKRTEKYQNSPILANLDPHLHYELFTL